MVYDQPDMAKFGEYESEAEKVARCLHWLARTDTGKHRLDAKKLQKILYYVQGWSLALRGRPAFSERIKAWEHGPVVPQVLHANREPDFRGAPIPDGDIPPEDMAFIASVWERYKHFTDDQLEDMTHEEPPWINAYTPDANGRCEEVIPIESIRDYFASLIDVGMSNDELLDVAKANRPPESWYQEPI